MKKTMMMIMATALIMAIPMTTPAQNSNQPTQNDASTTVETSYWEENFSVTAGFKIWRVTNSFKIGTGDNVDTTSNMYGPSVNLTMFEKFYTGLSYYWGSGFDYTVKSTYEGEDFEMNVDGKKSDLDIWAGYHFHPRASVFLGYKSSTYKRDGKVSNIISNVDYEASYENIFSGPVVGLNGNYPIMESGFVLFGTLGYAFLDTENTFKEKATNTYRDESVTESEKKTREYRGPAIECGASYMFKNIPQLSLSGGYKYQRYENVDNSDDYMEFSGFTFGANYLF